jgi:2C-methyl-D-erythritol 2,4-cyclodiphosphate synthase
MHFPDTDPAYHDASSISMLGLLWTVRALGFRIANLDVTVSKPLRSDQFGLR